MERSTGSGREPIMPGVDVGRAIRTGVITNPQSGRNRRGNSMRKILDALAQHPSVSHYEVSDLGEMTAAALEPGLCLRMMEHAG